MKRPTYSDAINWIADNIIGDNGIDQSMVSTMLLTASIFGVPYEQVALDVVKARIEQ